MRGNIIWDRGRVEIDMNLSLFPDAPVDADPDVVPASLRKEEACGGAFCGGANSATYEMHSCPYDADINDDASEKCKCCEECRSGCGGGEI